MIKEVIKRIFEKLFQEGVYISVDMKKESYNKVKSWMEKNIPNAEQNHKQHCTIIYSKGEYEMDVPLESYIAQATFKNFALFGPEKNILVAQIDCPKLTERNKKLTDEFGFVSDFPDYKPHFTLAYDIDIDISELEDIDFLIFFGNEKLEQLNLDWK